MLFKFSGRNLLVVVADVVEVVDVAEVVVVACVVASLVVVVAGCDRLEIVQI